MAKPPVLDADAPAPFSIPRGVRLEIAGDKVRVEYEGDVVIGADLGWKYQSVRAGGDLTMDLPSLPGDLVAGGVLRVTGDIDGNGVIHGREVVLGDQNVRCRVISAEERITIGAATINAEVILAPEIYIDPRAQGRVTVIESYNERDATKIKGGFSLADYEDMFGNSEEFLAQRGLTPLTGPRPPSAQRPAARPEAAPPPPAGLARPAAPAAQRTPFEDTPTPLDHARVEQRVNAARQRAASDEDVEDPLSMSIEDMDAVGNRKRGGDETHQRIVEALERVIGSYAGSELPPPVVSLRTYVEQRDHDGLRQNIAEVWNALLTYHQRRGIRPHHQVTHAFNVIHGLVQA